MISGRCFTVLVVAVMLLPSCSRNEAPKEVSTESAALERLVTEVGTRYRRPELTNLMYQDTFVGSFPKTVAALLREIEKLEGDYVIVLQESSSTPAPVLAAHQAFERYAREAAELYELMGAADPGVVKSTLNGLEISDPSLGARYDRQVDESNAAHDEFDAAIKALTTEQQLPFSRIGVTAFFKK